MGDVAIRTSRCHVQAENFLSAPVKPKRPKASESDAVKQPAMVNAPSPLSLQCSSADASDAANTIGFKRGSKEAGLGKKKEHAKQEWLGKQAHDS